MKTPTLEEVREHFKNAKIIKWTNTNSIFKLPKNYKIIEEKEYGRYHLELNGGIKHKDDYTCLFSDGKYAKIIKYKEPSKKTLLEFYKKSVDKPNIADATIIKEIENIHPNEFKQITDSISDLLEYKNKKYGRSALNPIKIFEGKTKVGQRLDDKISRVKNSGVLRKNDIADIIGYLILVCKENNWTDFSEFKD